MTKRLELQINDNGLVHVRSKEHNQRFLDYMSREGYTVDGDHAVLEWNLIRVLPPPPPPGPNECKFLVDVGGLTGGQPG